MPRNSTFYKPFKKKYVVGTRECGDPEIGIFTEDNKGNRIPKFYDTKAEAALDMADHIRLTAEAVQKGDMPEDRLDDIPYHFLAEATLFKDGHLYIVSVENISNTRDKKEILFDDNIINLM